MTLTIDTSSEVTLDLFPLTEEEELLQNLYCLISTALNEVPCYREFGIDKSYMSAPMNLAKTMFVSAIAEAIANFFPDIRLENVDFDFDEDNPGTMGCRIEVTDNE